MTLKSKTKTSVKSVLERPEGPTVKTCYWSRLPGKIVDKHTGDERNKLPFNDPIEWAQTLLETITDQSNLIHRKSMIGPAQFVVVGDFGRVLLEWLVSYRPFLDEKEINQADLNLDFEDAQKIGMLLNRWVVFHSDKIPENQILVGLGGKGVEYLFGKSGTDGIPMIDVQTTDKPYSQIGQVEHWGLVEILDVGII